MKGISARLALFLLPAPLLVACGGPTEPDLLIEPIQIDSVDVVVMETAPAAVAAHVRGVLGDGCSVLHSVSQKRSGNIALVTILRERPREAICTQVARLFDQSIPLQGPFPPGRYVVRVNDVEKLFDIP